MPEMAVLIPQEEEVTEGGGQDMPPGFHVIVLPFVDDIRAPPKVMTENLLGQFATDVTIREALIGSQRRPDQADGQHREAPPKQGGQVSVGSVPKSR